MAGGMGCDAYTTLQTQMGLDVVGGARLSKNL